MFWPCDVAYPHFTLRSLQECCRAAEKLRKGRSRHLVVGHASSKSAIRSGHPEHIGPAIVIGDARGHKEPIAQSV